MFIFLIMINNIIEQIAIIRVVKFVQLIAFCIVPHTTSYWCSQTQAFTQNTLFNWEDAIIKAHAFVNHTTTGWDKKFTTTHSFSNQSDNWNIQTNKDKSAAYTINHSGFAVAIGCNAIAVISDTIATGQVANCLDDQKKAATITGKKDAYSPIWTGNPASWAYAIDCGIRTKATVVQAIISALRTSLFFNSQIHDLNGVNLFNNKEKKLFIII